MTHLAQIERMRKHDGSCRALEKEDLFIWENVYQSVVSLGLQV